MTTTIWYEARFFLLYTVGCCRRPDILKNDLPFFAEEDLCKNPSEKILGKSGKVYLAQSDMAILRNKGIFP